MIFFNIPALIRFEREGNLFNYVYYRYPPGFVKQYVRKIVVAGKITAKGHPIGGYAKVGSGIVFLSTGRSGISSLGPIFHHEFNHVLYGYANQTHAAEAFAMATDSGFRYGRGGIDYILSGNGGCSPSEDWFAKGFVCNYGTACLQDKRPPEQRTVPGLCEGT